MPWRPWWLLGAIILTLGSVSAEAQDAAGVPTGEPSVMVAVAPHYPDLGVAARVQADVEVELDIAADGVPKTVRPIRMHPVFEQASLAAARQWRFGPSQAESRRCTVTFEFHLLPESALQSGAATRFMPPFKIEIIRVPLPATINYSH